jgi:electron transfer flavoprotein beta subunit
VHIVVCVKHTPDSEASMFVDEAGNISRDASPVILNPWDEHAVEEALSLRQSFGATVTALSFGPEEAVEALRYAVAMGCNEAIRVWDEGCAESDTLVTSYVLSRAIERMGDVDLVLFGRSSIDTETGQVPPAVARRLGYSSLMYVVKLGLDMESRVVTVEQMFEEGRQVLSAPLPAVVGTVKGLNEPRYATFKGLRRASSIEYPTWGLADIGVERTKVGSAGSGVRWLGASAPSYPKSQVELMQAETVEGKARDLVERLKSRKVL